MSLQADTSRHPSMDDLAVENFRKYLRIPSVQPNVDYDSCVSFIRKQASSLGLPLKIHYCAPKKPILIITWLGTQPELPSVLLGSHMDVVPAFKEEWTYDPFAAHMDAEGNIFARGAQDMKSVGIQYLEAVRRLRKDKVSLKRTVHIAFMPDEETGSYAGMRAFVKSYNFKALNVGISLNEAGPSPVEEYVLCYDEKITWQMRFHCHGITGHGSTSVDNAAGAKARIILDRFLDFQKAELTKLEENPSLTTDDIVVVNVTEMKGGVLANVIPPVYTLVFDCRLPVTADLNAFENMINRWRVEAGEDVAIEYLRKEHRVSATVLDDSNSFWTAFKNAADEINIQVVPIIAGGTTDNFFVRDVGIPGFGFSPINYTEGRLHGNNEYLNKDVFLRGITIYYKLITALANVPAETD